MAMTKEHVGRTPRGGVRSQINFRNDDGDPVDESEATAAEIVEYDAGGREIGRTTGTIGKGSDEEE